MRKSNLYWLVAMILLIAGTAVAIPTDPTVTPWPTYNSKISPMAFYNLLFNNDMELYNDKANKTEVNTPAEIDSKILDAASPIAATGTKATAAVTADTLAVGSLITEAQLPTEAVTESELTSALADKANTSDTDTSAEVDSKISTAVAGAVGTIVADITDDTKAAKAVTADVLAVGSSITEAQLPTEAITESELTSALAVKANIADTDTSAEVDSKISAAASPIAATGTKATEAVTADVLAVGSSITEAQLPTAATTDSELTSALAAKADVATTYTKTEVDTAIGSAGTIIADATDNTKAAIAVKAETLETGADIDVGSLSVSGVDGINGLTNVDDNTSKGEVGQLALIPINGVWNKVEAGVATEIGSGGGDSLPAQTGNSGKYLTTDGTDASWGTVTQVDAYTKTEANALLADKIDTSALDNEATSGSDKIWSIDQIKAYVDQNMGYPTLAITSPATDGTWITATPYTGLAGTATDNVSLTSVQWKLEEGGTPADVGGTLPDWTVPSIPTIEGDNTVYVTATDGDGHIATRTRIIKQDTVLPVVDLGIGVDHDGYGDSFEITSGMVTDTHLDSVAFNLNGAANTPVTLPYTVTVPATGIDYTLSVTATDLAGNEGTDTKLFTYIADTTLPVIVADADSTHDGSTPFTGGFTLTEAHPDTVTFTAVNATPTSGSMTGTYPDYNTPSITPDGTSDITLTYASTDEAGNAAIGTDLEQLFTHTAPPSACDVVVATTALDLTDTLRTKINEGIATRRMGNKYTPTETKTLCAVSVVWSDYSGDVASHPYTYQLWLLDASNNAVTKIAETTSFSHPANNEVYKAALITPATVTAGESYAVLVYDPTTPDFVNFGGVLSKVMDTSDELHHMWWNDDGTFRGEALSTEILMVMYE